MSDAVIASTVVTEPVKQALQDIPYTQNGGSGTPKEATQAAWLVELNNGLRSITDMALIVLPEQHEIDQMKKLDLDIESYRKRMYESQPTLTDEDLG
jgi:hypothetical protein